MLPSFQVGRNRAQPAVGLPEALKDVADLDAVFEAQEIFVAAAFAPQRALARELVWFQPAFANLAVLAAQMAFAAQAAARASCGKWRRLWTFSLPFLEPRLVFEELLWVPARV